MCLFMCYLITIDSNAAKKYTFLNKDNNRPYYVESLPIEMPIEEGPPEAIDGTINEVYVEALKEKTPILEDIGTYKLTFYCPCHKCSGNWGYQTSSGATCQEGVTVACAILSPGTEIYIDGVGNRIVQDTGGGVRGKHIDVFMESHEECLNNGIKYAQVYLVKKK